MKISVCLATYNGEFYICDQISSIVGQLSGDDELLVADDGSTDSTVDLIRQFGPPVRLVASERIGGVVRNFERVLTAASGDAIVLCDQDDVWLPGRIDLIRMALVDSDLVVLNGQVVNADLTSRGRTIFDSVGMKSGFLSNLLKNSFIGCCMAFRRDLRDRVVPFPSCVPWHDWYIGLVAELLGNVKRIDEITLLYRRHGANFSPTGEKSGNSFGRKLMMRLSVLFAVLVAVFRRRSSTAIDG